MQPCLNHDVRLILQWISIKGSRDGCSGMGKKGKRKQAAKEAMPPSGPASLSKMNQQMKELHLWAAQVANNEKRLEALFQLGTAYYHGTNVKKNLQTAVKYWEEAAVTGSHPQCFYNLAVCHRDGFGVEKNMKQADAWLQASAEAGQLEAQMVMGVRSYSGDGFPVDKAKAVEYWRKAALQGNSDAAHNVASCYRDGEGVERDYKEALKWYRDGAEQGDMKCQFNLAIFYKKGQSCDQDYDRAFKWLQKSAEQGFPNALYHLGNAYSEGQGCNLSMEKAMKIWEKAANVGSKEAVASLLLARQKQQQQS